MAYRFTNTDKWCDAWFSNLKPMEKLLFNYICDNCDIAGFIEVNYKLWASFIGSDVRTIEGACKGLARGLIYSNENDCIYIRNFLKHQKNYPLNENNKSHVGILKRFTLYSNKFDIQDINDFILRGFEGACKGVQSPTGNGNGIGNDLSNKVIYKYNKFYDEQIELSNNDVNYTKFVEVLFGDNNLKIPLKGILGLKNQVTFDQFAFIHSAKIKYNVSLTTILENIENRPDLLKNYSLLQRVILNWMKPKEFKK